MDDYKKANSQDDARDNDDKNATHDGKNVVHYDRNVSHDGGENWKNKNFIDSVKHTIDGIIYAVKHERNIKIQLCLALLATICGFAFKISYIEWCVLMLTIFFVLVAEMINTAIEKTVDLCTEKYNEIAKVAKDVSSGAVLISAICSVIIGLILFLPRFWGIFYIFVKD